MSRYRSRPHSLKAKPIDVSVEAAIREFLVIANRD